MIKTTKPTTLYISNTCIKSRFTRDNKYYVVDNAFNELEISKEDYYKLHCPIRNLKKESEVKNDEED